MCLRSQITVKLEKHEHKASHASHSLLALGLGEAQVQRTAQAEEDARWNDLCGNLQTGSHSPLPAWVFPRWQLAQDVSIP